MKDKIIRPNFGEIFFAELTSENHVQGGKRPVVIAQNNMGNQHSPTVEVIPLTSQTEKARYMPTHVVISANSENGLHKDSVVLCEQNRTINMTKLINRIGILRRSDLVKIGKARNIQSPFPAA